MALSTPDKFEDTGAGAAGSGRLLEDLTAAKASAGFVFPGAMLVVAFEFELEGEIF